MPAGGAPVSGGVMPMRNMPMGGGVINANIPPGMIPPGGHAQAQMVQASPANGIHFHGQRTQVRFTRPSGMKVSWFTQGPDGHPAFSTTPVEAPGRYNFPQAAIYRLKLSNIEGRPGLEIYPTMEVVPCNPKTEAFLAHSAVPVEFTNEDFKQIAEGNYVVKVIYLPDPQFQDVAGTGTDEILSTRLEPGADPIQEALRRGSILLVIRMGNVDQEAPNTPPLNAPGPHAGMPMPSPSSMVPPHGVQVPWWGMKTPEGMVIPPPGGLPPPLPNGSAAAPKFNGPMPGPFNVPSAPLAGMPPANVPPGSAPLGAAPYTGAPPIPPAGPLSTMPRPPSAMEVSNPKASTMPMAPGMSVPGTSSTSKFNSVPSVPTNPAIPAPPIPGATPATPPPLPPLPGAASVTPLPQGNVPAFPTMPGNIQGPAPATTGPNLLSGPSLSPTDPRR